MKIVLYSDRTKKQYMLIPICNNHVLISHGFVSHFHLHPVYHLVFVLNGQGYLSNNSNDYCLKENDIFIVNPNEKHIYTSDNNEGMTHFTVNFYLLSIENYQLLDREGVWEKPIDKKRIEPLAETMKLEEIFEFSMNDIFFGYDHTRWDEILMLIDTFCNLINNVTKDPYYILSEESNRNPLLFSGYYSKFIMALFEFFSGSNTQNRTILKNSNDALLDKMIHHLNKSVHKNFHLSDLATSLNYSPVYLCSYFKRKTGMTITQFLNKLKINKACEYLRASNKNITEIASILNFSSSNHFSNNFKKEKRVSPKDYRKHPEML